MKPIWLIKAITFISAFLLFQIELIIGKVFLPNFGGSYLVWGACVVFFQAVMLVGYKYSQVVSEKFGIERYRKAHCILALIPLLSFPGRSLPMTFNVLSIPMVLGVFWQLCLTIGLVFFVLSTTSIIWQIWLSASTLDERNNPYALFAVSNLGSFAALLTYPFYFEAVYDLTTQQNIWRVLYIVFIALQWTAYSKIKIKKFKQKPTNVKSVEFKKVCGWLLYGASGVMMFLAATNMVTAEIAPIPLLWVLPLMIYLLSFVLNFKRKPYCPGWIISEFHMITGLGVLYYFIMKMNLFPIAVDIVIISGLTFCVCMFAQYKIFCHRPANKRMLAYYYYIISLGSFLGGIVVTWIVPLVSTSYIEYFCGFIVIVIALILEKREKQNILCYGSAVGIIAILLVGPVLINKIHSASLIIVLVSFAFLFSHLSKCRTALIMCLVLCVALANLIEDQWDDRSYIYKHRNYYGISKIEEREGVRFFWHGTTIHGAQYVDPSKAHIPITYYNYDSPIGQVMNTKLFAWKNIGVLGLGVGTIATYSQEGQAVDYFELEEDVLKMAQTQFTYLKNAKAKMRYLLGDGRLLLKDIEAKRYDLLIADAYSGDTIPLHLLSKEALQIYRQSVNEQGVIILHISNRYIDSGPPLVQTAMSMGANACIKYGDKTDKYTEESVWVALTWDDRSFKKLTGELGWDRVLEVDESVPIWSDQYATVLPYIKFDELLRNSRYVLYFKESGAGKRTNTQVPAK